MVSLGNETSYHSNMAGRSDDRVRPDTDTTQLIAETDEVAFWDMAAGNGFPSNGTPGVYEEANKFHPIKNIPWIALVIFVVLLNAVFSFVAPEICPDAHVCNGITPFHIMGYMQIMVFVILLLVDILLRRLHFKSRSWGYLDFYRKTRVLRGASLTLISLGMASFLFVTVLTETLCGNMVCSGKFFRINCAQIACCLEAAVLLPVCGRYIYISYQFNRSQATPDVLQEDLSTERILQTSVNHGNQVGFKDRTFKEELLEKQADEIMYLKKRNAYLSSRILHLTRQINSSGELSAV